MEPNSLKSKELKLKADKSGRSSIYMMAPIALGLVVIFLLATTI